jgi:hypothetical protein
MLVLVLVLLMKLALVSVELQLEHKERSIPPDPDPTSFPSQRVIAVRLQFVQLAAELIRHRDLDDAIVHQLQHSQQLESM